MKKMSLNIFSGTVIRMNTDGTDVRVIVSGLAYPRGLTTICFPNNEPTTTVTSGIVSSATTTLADNTNPVVSQSDVAAVTTGIVSSATTTLAYNTNPVVNRSDVAIVTGMLKITDFKFSVERLKNMIRS